MTKPVTTKSIFIRNRLYKEIGVKVMDQIVEVPFNKMGDGIIGVMFVYEKIPDDMKNEGFSEAEI